MRKWTDFYKRYRDDLATFTYPLLEDPSRGGWTALQPWNPDKGSGFLLAYRQGATNDTETIPLRGVPEGRTFSLTALDPATGTSTPLGTFSSADLRSGVAVTIDHQYGYAIIRIEPS